MLCCSVRCFNKASMLHFSPVSVWECVSAFECEWMSDFCGVFWLLQTIATLVFLLFPSPPHPDWFISRGTLHFYSNLASLHPYLQVLKFSFFVCLFFKSYDLIFVIFLFWFWLFVDLWCGLQHLCGQDHDCFTQTAFVFMVVDKMWYTSTFVVFFQDNLNWVYMAEDMQLTALCCKCKILYSIIFLL